MALVEQFWSGFSAAFQVAPLYLALATAGLWADRHYGKDEEVRLSGALIIGFVAGVVLTKVGINVPFEPWMFAVPLIVLGAIVALQSAQVSSNVAAIVLLLIGAYFGLGKDYSQGQIAGTVGVAVGAVMALASGIGIGTVLSGFIGNFFVRIVGVVVAVAGVLMVVDVKL